MADRKGKPLSAVDQLSQTLLALRRANQAAEKSKRRWWNAAPGPPRPIGLVNAHLSANPFEFYILIALTLLGLLFTFGIAPPKSIVEYLPGVPTRLWTGTLAVGTLSALVGGLWRKNIEWGLAAYQFGYGLSGTACLVYGIAVATLFGEQAVFLYVQCFAFTVAAYIRVYEVARYFKIAEMIMIERARMRRGSDGTGGG